jgi:hypothetical protein
VTLFKDVILAGAAITAAVVAVIGLGTWQRQLKGQADYELSRRILVTLFKYRDGINAVRHPYIPVYEMPFPPEDEAARMDSKKLHFYGVSKAYQARWEKVQTERASLYADLLKAEALWGNELKNLFKLVFDLEHELFTRIRHYLELINPDIDEESKKAIREINKKSRDIMYDDLSDEGDQFKKDLLAGIQGIEKYIKPKLKH